RERLHNGVVAEDLTPRLALGLELDRVRDPDRSFSFVDRAKRDSADVRLCTLADRSRDLDRLVPKVGERPVFGDAKGRDPFAGIRGPYEPLREAAEDGVSDD